MEPGDDGLDGFAGLLGWRLIRSKAKERLQSTGADFARLSTGLKNVFNSIFVERLWGFLGYSDSIVVFWEARLHQWNQWPRRNIDYPKITQVTFCCLSGYEMTFWKCSTSICLGV